MQEEVQEEEPDDVMPLRKTCWAELGAHFSRLLEMAPARDQGAPQYCIVYSKNGMVVEVIES